MESMVLGEIKKNLFEKVQISISEYKGSQFLDVRIYALLDNGRWVPTQRGITVSPKRLDEMLSILNSAKDKFTIHNGDKESKLD